MKRVIMAIIAIVIGAIAPNDDSGVRGVHV